MSSNLIRKSFDGITKAVDESKGIVEAIVNSTGIEDLQRDVMEPGCWEPLCRAMKSGEEGYPAILWGHEWTLPVGKVLDAEELLPGDGRLKSLKAKKGAGGLRIVGQYNLETQRGREAFSDVKNGVIKHWSVGFMPADDGHGYDQKGVHHISKVGIWPEVSNVLVGASPGTFTAVAKSAEDVLATDDGVVDKALALEQLAIKAMVEAEGDESDPWQDAFQALLSLVSSEDIHIKASVEAPAEVTEEQPVAEQSESEEPDEYLEDILANIAPEFTLSEASPHHNDPANSDAEPVVDGWGQRLRYRLDPAINSPTPEEFLPT